MEQEVEGAGIAVIAVDGGASRCRLAAFGETGKRLCETAVDAPASLTLGVDDAWETIQSGVMDLLAQYQTSVAVDRDEMRGAKGPVMHSPDRDIASRKSVDDNVAWPRLLSLGLAGSLQGARHARFLQNVRQATAGAVNCLLVTDGHAQLLGASKGQPGVCMAVGTGSVVHWLDQEGQSGMAGGWGFPVGDEGSGAWLGSRLLQRYIWHRDGWKSDSSLMPLLDAQIGESVSSVQRVTTDARSTTHARWARAIVDAASNGDRLAVSLLDEGSEWCFRLIERAPSALPVYVVGGLAEAYASRLSSSLGERLQTAQGDALDGLAQLALGEEH